MSSSTSNTFTLLVPAHIQSVQLLGSWDNYGRKYEMCQSRSTPGTWRLNIKFPETGSSGSKRYWYYYILDGYFESHDPNMPTTQEPTRGITLNILDLVRSGTSSPRDSSPEPTCHRVSIIAPKPRNPMAAHALTLDTSAHSRLSTYSDVATIASSSPRSSYSGSPLSASSDSDYESPITPVDYYSDGEEAYASDSSAEFTHSVRPTGKYAFEKSKRHGHYDLAAELAKVRIAN
jgi:hypothetical protein